MPAISLLRMEISVQEQNSKSKERLRFEEQRAKYEQKLREQIKKDERQQREREKSLKLLIGELFTKNLPDYMLYEEAEMERIIAAAMGSDACRDAIESIKAEAGNATGTSSDGTQKPRRSGTSKSDDEVKRQMIRQFHEKYADFYLPRIAERGNVIY